MVGSEKILSLYKQNEKVAMQLLFDVYYDPLLLYCNRMVHDAEGAEDIVQECFVHLWFSRRLQSFEGDLDRCMFQAVRFRTINYIRDKHRRDKMHDDSSVDDYILPGILREEEAGQEIELLYRTINRLPDECRKIFLMAALDDMKYQEIADALQISVNTVKTQMKIALRFLREHLNKESFSSILLFFVEGVF